MGIENRVINRAPALAQILVGVWNICAEPDSLLLTDIHGFIAQDKPKCPAQNKNVFLHTVTEMGTRYSRMAYEAGFSPVCPVLYMPLFLNDSVPEEHKAGIDMRRDLLRRSHVLVVCGGDVDEDVKNDIAVAGRLGIAATTLDGILAVKGLGKDGGGH